MKVLGIGNAIVDVICKVEENFISKNNLIKGTMKLFSDEIEFKNLLNNLKIEKSISGGSVANSIVGLSQLKNEVGFIGKISDDNYGIKYEEGLKKENVKYFYFKQKENLPTGTCLILVTPDSERTMCTFLGIAGKINENDVDEEVIKKSKVVVVEDFLHEDFQLSVVTVFPLHELSYYPSKRMHSPATVSIRLVSVSLQGDWTLKKHAGRRD